MFTFSFVCNKVSSKPDLRFLTFSGSRYVCTVYNSPSVANSVILIIYRGRSYNFYVNKL
jgi:hypothetical protein